MSKTNEIHMIDDDEEIHELLNDYFSDTQYTLSYSDTPEKGIDYLKKHEVDLVLLDLMLPNMDGFDVCKKLREGNSQIPIIMLTAKKDEINKILGLELGADDYMFKPFNPRELLARIKSVLRRSERVSFANGNEKKENFIKSDTWHIAINLDSRQVSINNQDIDFTTTEFELLKCLMENAGIVQSRDNLMNKIKGIDFESFDRSIDVFISKVRQKIGDSKGEIIKTVRGIGYIFVSL